MQLVEPGIPQNTETLLLLRWLLNNQVCIKVIISATYAYGITSESHIFINESLLVYIMKA